MQIKKQLFSIVITFHNIIVFTAFLLNECNLCEHKSACTHSTYEVMHQQSSVWLFQMFQINAKCIHMYSLNKACTEHTAYSIE